MNENPTYRHLQSRRVAAYCPPDDFAISVRHDFLHGPDRMYECQILDSVVLEYLHIVVKKEGYADFPILLPRFTLSRSKSK